MKAKNQEDEKEQNDSILSSETNLTQEEQQFVDDLTLKTPVDDQQEALVEQTEVMPEQPKEEAIKSEVVAEPAVVTFEASKKRNLPKKSLFVAVAAALVLVVGAFTFMANKNNQNQAPIATDQQQMASQMKGAVTVLDGTALISEDGEVWKTLSQKDTLKQGDWVRSDESSRVVITLDDGSAIRLEELSSVQLKKLESNDVVVVNANGQIYTRVVESDRAFNVEVNGQTYKALGTAYKTINSEKVKGVQVYQSTVALDQTKIDEGKQYFEQNPSNKLTQKVTDIPVGELQSDEFMKWNLEQDKKSDEFKNKLGFLQKIEAEKKNKEKTEAPKPAPAEASFSLTGQQASKGIQLNWSIASQSGFDGFKVIKSTSNSNPTYGVDGSVYVSDPSTRSFLLDKKDGKFYYIRVCTYDADKNGCTAVSNVIKVQAPYQEQEKVKDGTVTLSATGQTINWTFTGTAPHGFKVVASKTDSTPSYPNQSKYYIGPGTTSVKLKDFSPGSYFVRVCKYTADPNISGGCTNYSNSVTVNIP
jgi:ferric-dicitrate binding protein FerR (iron transport regulator)